MSGLRLLLAGNRSGVEGPDAPAGRTARLLRGHPEVPFLLCLIFFVLANFTSLGSSAYAPLAFREVTLQATPADPVLPFTLAAVAATFGVVVAVLTRPIGLPRSVIVAASVSVGAVGIFELAYSFIRFPASFWLPAHLNLSYWRYGITVLSFATLATVGAGWWRLDRFWWYLAAATMCGFAVWYVAGVPLSIENFHGHLTPGNLLGVGLAVNVSLKWAVFALVSWPIVNGARPSVLIGSRVS
jgi:hypothetical protein